MCNISVCIMSTDVKVSCDSHVSIPCFIANVVVVHVAEYGEVWLAQTPKVCNHYLSGFFTGIYVRESRYCKYGDSRLRGSLVIGFLFAGPSLHKRSITMTAFHREAFFKASPHGAIFTSMSTPRKESKLLEITEPVYFTTARCTLSIKHQTKILLRLVRSRCQHTSRHRKKNELSAVICVSKTNVHSYMHLSRCGQPKNASLSTCVPVWERWPDSGFHRLLRHRKALFLSPGQPP